MYWFSLIGCTVSGGHGWSLVVVGFGLYSWRACLFGKLLYKIPICCFNKVIMSPHDMYETDDTSEIFSEGTISRCNSTEKLTLTELGDGLVEERFRVDRRKLEAMIQGCPPDPCDLEIMKLPIGMDGRILSADDFFQRIFGSTHYENSIHQGRF
ncbi:unnamed protein product [Meganyctiphanes norvegica]|uniref:Uncharacterized protein n=1 Tax=Meganyctiphanes norvegica TaxID=48144 RepID=A0AAV2QKD9_MEGNR